MIGGNSNCYPAATDSPFTALTAGKLPAVRAVQGDCEIVYGKAELNSKAVHRDCERVYGKAESNCVLHFLKYAFLKA